MKRFLFLFLLSSMSVWLTGCAITDSQRAQNTAKTFLIAMRAKDHDTLKNTVTAKAWGNLSSQAGNKDAQQKQADYSVGEAAISGDNAQVPVTVKEDGKETLIHVILRREDREWRVYAMTLPAPFGGSDLTIDFEHPETMLGEMFKGLGQGMGQMMKGMGEGMGQMMKGMQEGMKSATPPANATSGSPSR